MSQKPADEMWVVILNEFTDAGVDALSVAAVSHGRFDVRLVAGGCLCCVGELEFGKQLREILKTLAPDRLLIEPSGAGHAADIVDELAAYEARGSLTLDSVTCLVDAEDAAALLARRDVAAWSQTQAADVLLMSKPDLAGTVERDAFAAIADAQFPAKRHVGLCHNGALPPEALLRYTRAGGFSLARAEESAAPITMSFEVAGMWGSESRLSQLNLWAVSWILPRELTFARVELQPRLEWLLAAYSGAVRRFKAVFRTGPGPSWHVESHGRGLTGEDSAYRRDSRLELVLREAPGEQFLDGWRSMLRGAALAPRR